MLDIAAAPDIPVKLGSCSFECQRRRFTDLDSADHVDLSGVDADTTVKGDQAFTEVSTFDGHAGELTLSYARA